jgi:hypothetical protein
MVGHQYIHGIVHRLVDHYIHRYSVVSDLFNDAVGARGRTVSTVLFLTGSHALKEKQEHKQYK